MPPAAPPSPTTIAVRKWKRKRGSLIMALHEIQDRLGFVPRESALEVADAMGVPLARIYEVLTFYNYFKLKAPGKAVVSVCTGTACHLKGAPELVEEFRQELQIDVDETSDNGHFHLQCVRCVGCCGLAPVVAINGRIYGKMKPSEIHGAVADWRHRIEQGEV